MNNDAFILANYYSYTIILRNIIETTENSNIKIDTVKAACGFWYRKI